MSVILISFSLVPISKSLSLGISNSQDGSQM